MFPFFNNYPGTDLHEIDLAYILKLCAELRSSNATLTEWKAEHEEEYKELANKVEGLINNLVDVIRPWDSSIAYHIFSIVEYQGTNYIAVKDVPVGAMITNTEYWQPANTTIEQINAIGLIVSNLQENCMLVFNTVSDMQAYVNFSNDDRCRTLGYYAPGDGGAGVYIIGDRDTQNGGSKIDVSGNKTAFLQYDKINIMQWGAHPSSDIDSAAQFQAAFDNSAGYTIFIPENNYYISVPIELKLDNYKITGNFKYPAWHAGHNAIRCESGFLHKETASGENEIQISGISVRAVTDGKCFENIGFKHSVFNRCSFNNFDYVFYNSPFTYFSQMIECSCMKIHDALMYFMNTDYDGLSLFESELSSCYFNGDRDSIPNLFITNTLNTIDIQDCYIDFFKYIITSSDSSGNCIYNGTRFNNNVFDYCYRFTNATSALSRYATNVGYMQLENNVFKNAKKASASSIFTNPDSDMINNDWGGIIFELVDRPYGGWLNIINNTFFNCDAALIFKGGDNWHNHTSGNKFSQCTRTIEYQNTVVTHTTYDALRTCSFEEINNQDVTALESDVQKVFINEIAYLNKVFYRVANNGVFYKADGTIMQ